MQLLNRQQPLLQVAESYFQSVVVPQAAQLAREPVCESIEVVSLEHCCDQSLL